MKEYIVICNIDTEVLMDTIRNPHDTMEEDIKLYMNWKLGAAIEVLSVTEKG